MAAPADLIFEKYDAATATESTMRARYDLACEIEAEQDPDTPMYPYDVWVAEMRREPSWTTNHRWIVWAPDRARAVASAYLGLQYTETNRHLAWFDIAVRVDSRRQGIGRQLLAEIIAVGKADERTVLGSGALQGHEAEEFLKAMGLEQKMVDRRSRLLLDQVDRGLLDQWIADAGTKATDYELVFVDGAMPEELLLPMVDLEHTMNDAPRDELDMEDWVITPERWREKEKLEAETGNRRWTLIARHIPTDELAGFTAIGWHPSIETLGWQYGTAVRPAHRGAGLGRWMKAAMLVKVFEEMPQFQFIDTWNAGSNKWMLAINIALGYAPYLHYTDWQASTETLEKAVS